MSLPWVRVAPEAPYFVTDEGESFTPIGQNDAITWPEFAGLMRGRDPLPSTEYCRMLRDHGVTTLRLMLEYAQFNRGFIEGPCGRFRKAQVKLWDDLFALCAEHGLRILLTPVDTFWMWIRWAEHPYNAKNGGPCQDRTRMLHCPETRAAIKRRLAFASERWGGTGTLFAWDLWNEIHPSYSGNSAEVFEEFITDLSDFLRDFEMRTHGRAHPQTVSVFTPHMVLDSHIPEAIFRHPRLDFVSTHLYEEGTIDHPANTVDAAVAVGRLVREALAEIRDRRPYFDSEHGPIHTFKDHHRTLPEPFDDEYFRHIQWAHLASGGAGGGMRWPNRNPHSLTPGMRREQRSLAGFAKLIDWARFDRVSLTEQVQVSSPELLHVFAIGDRRQAVLYLLRRDSIAKDGTLDRSAAPLRGCVKVPGLDCGTYRAVVWDTASGSTVGEHRFQAGDCFPIEVQADRAYAIVPA